MRRRRAPRLALVGRRAIELIAGVPAGTTDYAVTRDLRVPMRDGTVLLGDLYRPRGAAAMPVVLIRTPYGRANLGGALFAVVLARRGFQVLIQSVRGTFGSEGVFRPFAHEHEDGMDTLAWVRAQRWCDGRVATTGGSYFAHTQWAVAPYADPPLAASSLHITAARMSASFYEGGAPGALNALTWSDSIARQERRGVRARFEAARPRRRVVTELRTRPLRDADVRIAGRPEPFWRDVTEHAEPGDPFWSASDHSRAPLERMPPVNMVTGWWDLFLPFQLEDFARLQAAGVPARLTIGPWLHGAMPEVREMLRSDLAFLDHQLRGGPAPEAPPVRIALQGTDRWLTADTWPLPGTRDEERHLASGELLRTGASAAEGLEAIVFDPAAPTTFDGGPLLSPPGQQVDDGASEARPDVLVFTGAPEPRDLDVVGRATVRLHVRSERAHADVFVRLCDVDADGVSRNVADGIRRLDPRTVPADDVLIGDDGVLAVDVPLFPTAYRFRAGHRVRLVVAGGDFPRYAPNPGTGEPLPEAGTGLPNRLELLHGPAHPSRIVLPVHTGS